MSIDCQSGNALAEIIVRGLLLSLVCIGGMLSIYLGWRLYAQALSSETAGEISWATFKVKLSAASPGVFLAAFGAFLLYSTSTHRFELSFKQEQVSPTSHSVLIEGQVQPFLKVQDASTGDRQAKKADGSSCDCLLSKSTTEWTIRRLSGSDEVTVQTLQEDVMAIQRGLALVKLTPEANAEDTATIGKAVRSVDRLAQLLNAEAAKRARR